MQKQPLFALDIGTRSVVGLVAEPVGDKLNILAFDRQEHQTRAMLDGQIHDVPQVAAVLKTVKDRLEAHVGPLKKVAVAAAGRALLTLRINADLDVATQPVLDRETERTLELAAIQAAQVQLAKQQNLPDPTGYYCVGYSVVSFILDGTRMGRLVGQKGKKAEIELIATFLPRQVIDSMQSALKEAGLEMSTLTLEPIAAINVLIPPTMRHLNLALVDVGAGTSDVALTADGSVVGYGMVPCAGDEVTEALSQAYLLDFNVAEKLKRQLHGKARKLTVKDVLGGSQKIESTALLASIVPIVNELAERIAREISTLNQNPPQAVLLVGGGALTPGLPEAVAQKFALPPGRVAVRLPEAGRDFVSLPKDLIAPDAITPLGILRIAGGESLHFVGVTVNGQSLRLFNLGKLTVADALLVSGTDIKTLRGKPGLGLTVTLNGRTQFIAGSHGAPGTIERNGQPATLETPLEEGDVLTVKRGTDGITPRVTASDLADLSTAITALLNGKTVILPPTVRINGVIQPGSTRLADRDAVEVSFPKTIGDLLVTGGTAAAEQFCYELNGEPLQVEQPVQLFANGRPAQLADPLPPNADVRTLPPEAPTLTELLALDTTTLVRAKVSFDGKMVELDTVYQTLTVNGKPAAPSDCPPTGAVIVHQITARRPIVSDVLLAAQFDPQQQIPPGKHCQLLVNDLPAEFTTPVKTGDVVSLRLSPTLD